MRILVSVAFTASACMLAGCGGAGGNDNEIRASMRENAISQCVAASHNAPNNAQYDWPRLCGCVTDRYMAGRSTADLQNADPQDPARRAISRQCAIEQMSAALGDIANGQTENSTAPGN
jgi:hypothetical protein